MLQWIQNYLAKKTVIFHGTDSALKNIICGIPQRSILGPLLFLIYINDIMLYLKLHFLLCLQMIQISSYKEKTWKNKKDLNIEFKKLTMGLKTNKLSLNIQKTHTMTFSNTHSIRTRHNKIYIDGTEIDTDK